MKFTKENQRTSNLSWLRRTVLAAVVGMGTLPGFGATKAHAFDYTARSATEFALDEHEMRDPERVTAQLDIEELDIQQGVLQLDKENNIKAIRFIDEQRAVLAQANLLEEWDEARTEWDDFRNAYISFLKTNEHIEDMLQEGVITPAEAYRRFNILAIERSNFLTKNNPHQIAKKLTNVANRALGFIHPGRRIV